MKPQFFVRWHRLSAWMPVLAGLLALLMGNAGAEEPEAGADEMRLAIDRGLKFLVKDSIAWKEEHGCVSCHHASLVVHTLAEAQAAGYSVDEPFLAGTLAWVAKAGDGAGRVPKRPKSAPQAMNYHAPYNGLALAAVRTPDGSTRQALQQMRAAVRAGQLEDGSWQAWPDTRPPFFGPSQKSATAFAAWSLAAGAAAERDHDTQKTLERALAWLRKAPPDDELQAAALHLLAAKNGGEPGETVQPLVAGILLRQGAGGGWAQTAAMAADAYATGQALCALAAAGLGDSDSAVKRGRQFLLKTQRPDGAWQMTSRPIPPEKEGAENLIPITGAGAAWAVLGLVKSSPARPAQRPTK